MYAREKQSKFKVDEITFFSFSKNETNKDNVMVYVLIVCGLLDLIEGVYSCIQV